MHPLRVRSGRGMDQGQMSFSTFIKQYPALACAYYVYDGWQRRRRLARGDIRTTSGTRHVDLDVGQSVAYITQVWRDYLRWSGRSAITGRVVEIGPGDNFGVALLLLRHGAEFVEAIDKFAPHRDAAAQARIYQALSDIHDLGALFSGPPREDTMRHVNYLPGMPAERYFADCPPFDAVLSRAVLEHLDDPLGSLDAQWARLRRGGLLLHRVDLRDHGMFSGNHPLTFLTISDRLYSLIADQTGRPNRILLPAYRAHAAAQRWPARFGITRLVGVAEEFDSLAWEQLPDAARTQALAAVMAIRPRLNPRFRALHDRDLAVSGFVLRADKAK